MRDGFGHVSVVSLLAVVAVASGRVVAAVQTHAAAPPARQLVQLHVEAAATSVKVTVACWVKRNRKKGDTEYGGHF